MHAGELTHHYREFADEAAKMKTNTQFACVVNKGDRFLYENGKVSPNL